MNDNRGTLRHLRMGIFAALSAALMLVFPCAAQPLQPGIGAEPRHANLDTTRIIGAIQTSAADSADGSTAVKKTAKKKGNGLTDVVNYEAAAIDYDFNAKTLILIGNAHVTYQHMTLLADTIRYQTRTNLLLAFGRPQFIEEGDTTLGVSMIYNIKTRRGRVQYATTHMQGSAFDGNLIVKSEKNQLYIAQGDVTTCARVEDPHYYFYGKTLKVIPGDKIIARPLVFDIADVPVGIMPYFMFPIAKGRKSGLLTPVWGGHPGQGGYLDNVGYYFVPNDYMDFTASGKVSEFKDYLFNASSRYNLRYQLSGSIAGQFAESGDFRQQDQRWSLDYAHNQNLLPDGSLTLAGRGSLVSDKNYYTQFSEDTSQLINKAITADLSLVKRFDGLNASAAARWDRTYNLVTDHTVEDIPSLSFGLSSRALFPVKSSLSDLGDVTPAADEDKEHWYNRIYGSYSAQALVKRDVYNNNTQPGFMRSGLSQSADFSMPSKIFNNFTVSPYFSAQLATFDAYMDTVSHYKTDTAYDTVPHVSWNNSSTVIGTFLIGADTQYVTRTISPPHLTSNYDNAINGIKNVPSWRTGVNVSTNLYGLFPVKLFNFAGIRHTLSPSIGYNLTPRHDLAARFFPVGIPYDDAHPRSQSISMSLGNLLEGKTVAPAKNPNEKPAETKFNIVSVSLSTAYDFEASKRKWSSLNASASTYYKFASFSYNSAYWLYDENNNLSAPLLANYSVTISTPSIGAGGSLWDGDRITLDKCAPAPAAGTAPLYAEGGLQQWSFGLNPSYSFSQSRTSPSPQTPFVTNKQYNLSANASIKFSRIWAANWSSYYNFVTNQLVGHTLSFYCDLECWELRFNWSPSGYNPGYYFLINIKKIPEIKWEKKENG